MPDDAAPPPPGPPPWEEPAPPPPPGPPVEPDVAASPPTPPTPQPTFAAATASQRPAGRAGALQRMIVLFLVVGILAGGFVYLQSTQETDQAAAGEIFLDASDKPGPNPFMPSVAASSEAATTTTATATTTTVVSSSTETTASTSTTVDGTAAVPAPTEIAAGTPGLYGGTRDLSSCDVAAMIAFLEGDDAKRSAWAAVQGIDADGVAEYLQGLTPVNLRADTRVTNHGFQNGVATPREAVLQAGTAVLVDAFGVPRAKCACGNPLVPPTPVTGTPTVQGAPWPAYAPEEVKVVQPAPRPIPTFTLVDPGGAPFTRPAGTDGADDRDPLPTDTATVSTALDPTTTSTSSPPSATTPTILEGTTPRAVSASSIYDASYPAALAVDGDPTTSWFSSGPTDDGTTTFTWEAPSTGRVAEVQIVSNALNANPDFRTGYGFDSLELQILDEAGEVVFTNSFELPGTPDPEITLRPDFEGATVRLVFSGSESIDCGGIAELRVVMAPA